MTIEKDQNYKDILDLLDHRKSDYREKIDFHPNRFSQSKNEKKFLKKTLLEENMQVIAAMYE